MVRSNALPQVIQRIGSCTQTNSISLYKHFVIEEGTITPYIHIQETLPLISVTDKYCGW